MRQLDSRLIHNARAVIEKIKVDRARAIAFVLRRAAESHFDAVEFAEKYGRGPVVADLDHRIKKFRRARFATDRFGFVERRPKQRRTSSRQRKNLSACVR